MYLKCLTNMSDIMTKHLRYCSICKTQLYLTDKISSVKCSVCNSEFIVKNKPFLILKHNGTDVPRKQRKSLK
jgi:LSD1 subclass zinc finger protein